MAPDALGLNPLAVMAVGRDSGGSYYLHEACVTADANGVLGWEWRPYEDHAASVLLPRYMPDMPAGHLRPLSTVTSVHDFMAHDGARNIGTWMDDAARRVGR